MKRKGYVGIVLVFLLWVGWTNLTIMTTTFTIENEKLPHEFDGYTLAHVSDLHNHPWGETLIEKMARANPDIIALTGDLVDSSKPDMESALHFIEEAQKIAPVYYVTGNHEARLDEYPTLKEKLEQAGVHMMDDQSVFIEKNRQRIQLVGIQDPDFATREGRGDNQGDIVRLKLGEQVNSEYFTLVLSHRPEHFDEYVDAGVGVVLTGHAHGGQVRLPFIGGLIAPNQGFFPTYTEGVYHEKQTDMVVSRGLGNSILPIRFDNTPELVIVNLKTK